VSFTVFRGAELGEKEKRGDLYYNESSGCH
jgi:hypothetical protein